MTLVASSSSLLAWVHATRRLAQANISGSGIAQHGSFELKPPFQFHGERLTVSEFVSGSLLA